MAGEQTHHSFLLLLQFLVCLLLILVVVVFSSLFPSCSPFTQTFITSFGGGTNITWSLFSFLSVRYFFTLAFGGFINTAKIFAGLPLHDPGLPSCYGSVLAAVVGAVAGLVTVAALFAIAIGDCGIVLSINTSSSVRRSHTVLILFLLVKSRGPTLPLLIPSAQKKCSTLLWRLEHHGKILSLLVFHSTLHVCLLWFCFGSCSSCCYCCWSVCRRCSPTPSYPAPQRPTLTKSTFFQQQPPFHNLSASYPASQRSVLSTFSNGLHPTSQQRPILPQNDLSCLHPATDSILRPHNVLSCPKRPILSSSCIRLLPKNQQRPILPHNAISHLLSCPKRSILPSSCNRLLPKTQQRPILPPHRSILSPSCDNFHPTSCNNAAYIFSLVFRPMLPVCLL